MDNKLNFIVTVDDKQIDEFRSKLKSVGGEVKKLETTTTQASAATTFGFSSMNLGVLGYAAALTGVIAVVQQFAMSSLNAFMEQEVAIKRLSFALGESSGSFTRLVEDANRLQLSTIYSDEVIIKAQSFLAIQGRTEEQIRKTIQAAIDLSAATGDDLMSAVMKLDMTYEGSIGRFGKLDSRLKDLTQSQLENGEAIDLIADKYKGLGEQLANTTQGQIEQTKNVWNDFTEGIGKSVSDIIVPFISVFKQVGISVKDFGSIIADVAIALVPLLFIIKNIAKGIEEGQEKFAGAKTEIIYFKNALNDFYGNIPVIGSGVQWLVSVFEDLTSSILGANTAMLDLNNTEKNLDKSGKTKEPEAGGATKSREKQETTAKKTKQTQKEIKDLLQEELNLIDNIVKLSSLEFKLTQALLIEQIKKVQSLKNENNTVEQKIKLLEKEKELTERLIKLSALKISDLQPKTLELGTVRAPIAMRNQRISGIDLSVSSEEIEMLREREKERYRNILDNTNSIVDNFAKMLQQTGLMETGFGRIIAMLQSMLSTADTVFNFLTAAFDIFKGTTSVVGGASGGGALAGGLPSGNQPIMFGNSINTPQINVLIRDVYTLQDGLKIEIPKYNNRINQLRY